MFLKDMKKRYEHRKCRNIRIFQCPVSARIELYERDYSNEVCSLHTALRPVLLLAQVFGVMPLRHAGSSNPRFRFCSWAAVYSCLLLCSLIAVMVFTMFHIATVPTRQQQGVDSASAGIIFYLNAILSMLLFIRLASHWPYLMEEWKRQELELMKPSRQSVKLRLTSASIIFFATCEHAVSVFVAIDEAPPDDVSGWMEKYCKVSHAFVFSERLLPAYNPWVGVLILVASNVATFAWNFTDLFIILVSKALTSHFVSFNENVRLAAAVNGDNPTFTSQIARCKTHYTTTWKKLRHTYAMLSSLVKTVDTKLSAIILLSFCNNVYFICLQLLNGLSPRTFRTPLVYLRK